MDWETKRIKDVFSFSKGLSITKEDLVEKGVPVISYGQIHSKQNKGVKIDDSLIRFVGEEHLTNGEKALTNKHDFLFADTSEDFEGCGNNVYVDRDMTLFAGYHTIILRNKKPQDCRYFVYQFNSDDWRTQIRKNVCGIKVYSITQKSLSNISLLVPPESMQKKISDFLDMKIQNIDARIELLEKKKERYITIRKAVINEAVNGEGKGWKKRRIKELFKIIGSGSTPDSNVESYYDENGYNWLQTGDLNDGIISSTSKKITSSAIQRYSTLKTYKKGSLVVAMYGATIGKVGLLDIDTTTNQACCVMSEPKEIDTKFMFYWFLSKKEFIISRATGGGQPNIGQDTIKFFEIEHPNLDEQQKIVSYLDKKTSAIDLIVSSITKQIDSLKTYRRALINEAVTGKLKIE